MANNALLHGCILRAAGIYGPGRIPRLDVLINNEPIAIDPESYLNLIHVVDLAGIVAAVFDGLTPHRIYNVADGNPVRRRDYYDFIARQIGSLPPRFEFANKQIQIMNSPVHALAKVQSDASTSTPAARSRGEGSKRIRTDLLKESVPYSFQFPNFQAGLTPLLPK
jgi:nucleoside-diphosphate-sugar epimerase